MRNGLILLFVCKMTVLTTIAQTSYYANYSHIFYTKKGGSFQISIPDKNKTYINTSTGQFVFNKPIYAKELLSINSSLNLEAATNCYINIKPRSSSYGLVIRKHDSNDFGNLKVTSLGLEFGYNTSTSNLIINTIGNVGVGGDPYSKLQVNTEGDPSFIEGEVRGNIQHGFQIWGTDQVMYMGVSTAKRVSYIQSVDMWTESSTLALNSRGGSVTIGH